MIKPCESRVLEKTVSFFCDPECKSLNIKERDQQRGDGHFCKKYKMQLLHEKFHPHLVRPIICVERCFGQIYGAALKKDLVK